VSKSESDGPLRQPAEGGSASSGLPAERKGGGRRRVSLALLLVVVVGGGLFGLRWIAYTRTHVKTDDAQVDSDIYPVSARVSGHVTRVLVQENDPVRAGQLLAEIDPRDYEVAAEKARAALAEANSSAEAAAGTATVTERTGAAGIAGASAQVAVARAGEVAAKRQGESAANQVDVAKADEAAGQAAIEVAKRAVSAAEARVTSSRALADEAQKNAARMEALLQDGAVSAQQHDAAVAQAVSSQAAVDVAVANLESAKAALQEAEQRHKQTTIAVEQAEQRAAAAYAQAAQARAGTDQAVAAFHSAQTNPEQARVRRSEAKGAQNRVTEAEATLASALLNLSYTKVFAPVDGMVAKKNVEAGQFVQPGQPLVAVVASGSEHVTANFKETDLGRIRPGQRVTCTVDAYPGTVFSGQVESISPGTGAVFSLLPPENASGNFTKVVQRIPVRIAVDGSSDPDLRLRAGMSVVVVVHMR